MESMTELFPKFNKIPRWYKQFTITEKVDGTNGVIQVWGPATVPFGQTGVIRVEVPILEGTETAVRYVAAGSRTRWLDPTAGLDNHGFGRWVLEHAPEAAQLGVGVHYGEWYGSGINRGYGYMNGEKHFALFNSFRWREHRPEGFGVVPVLWSGSGDDIDKGIGISLAELVYNGSVIAPGFKFPEGIVIYSDETKAMWKKYLVNDRNAKG